MSRGGSFLDKLLGGYKIVQWNGVPLPPETTLNLIGAALVVDNPSMGRTDATVGGGGSSGGGLVLVENNGAAMPFEPILNFVGFTIVDEPGSTRTTVSANPPGTLNVAGGGTGQTSLTAHAVVLGAGTAPVHFASPMSSGYVLTDNGPGADPTFQPATGGGGGGGSLPVPPRLITGTATLGAADTWVEFQAIAGGYTIDMHNVVAGTIYRLTHVGGAAGTNRLETPGQAVQLSAGSGPFTIEYPADRSAALSTITSCDISFITYNVCLDKVGAGGVLRCIGIG